MSGFLKETLLVSRESLSKISRRPTQHTSHNLLCVKLCRGRVATHNKVVSTKLCFRARRPTQHTTKWCRGRDASEPIKKSLPCLFAFQNDVLDRGAILASHNKLCVPARVAERLSRQRGERLSLHTHTPHVTRHTSHVTRHTSHNFSHNFVV